MAGSTATAHRAGAGYPSRGVEQVGEQVERAPVLGTFLNVVEGEPDVEVAELVEYRGAEDERATVHRIQVPSGDPDRGGTCFRINALAFVGHACFAHQPAQVDLDRAEHFELEVQQGDDALDKTRHSSAVLVRGIAEIPAGPNGASVAGGLRGSTGVYAHQITRIDFAVATRRRDVP